MRVRRVLVVAAVVAVGAGLLPTGSPVASAADAGAVRAAPLTAVDDGATAKVLLTLTRAASGPVEVRWATKPGTATAGADFQDASGTVTFPAGSAEGATRSVSVPTASDAGGETAETLRLDLAADGAEVAGKAPTVVVNAHGLPYLDKRLPGRPPRRRTCSSRMTLAEKVGQMTQAERGSVDSNRSLITTWNLGSVLSGGGSTPAQNTPERLGRHGRLLPVVRPRDPAADPADLRGRLGARARQPLRRDAAPAQHRAGRHPQPEAGRAGPAHGGHRDPRDRHPVDVRALRLRRARRPLGPQLRVVRRGPGAGEADADLGRRPPGQGTEGPRAQRPGARDRQALRGRRRHDVRQRRDSPGARQHTRSTRASPSRAARTSRRSTSRRTPAP